MLPPLAVPAASVAVKIAERTVATMTVRWVLLMRSKFQLYDVLTFLNILYSTYIAFVKYHALVQ